MNTSASQRSFDIHHLRQDAAKTWRSVRVRNAVVSQDALRVAAPLAFDNVEISSTKAHVDVDVELRRYDGGKVAKCNLAQQRVLAGRAVRVAPSDWDSLNHSKLEWWHE